MRHLLVALLACTSLVADAQVPIRAPVNVATKLYADCMGAKLMSAEIEPTRVGISEYMEYANEWCVTWTVIWVQPLIGRPLTDAEIERTGKNIDQIRAEITKQLRKDAMIR